MKSVFIIALLIVAVSAEKSFITFKSKACATLAQSYQVEVFGTETKFLENIGVMIVEMDSYNLFNTLLSKHEVHECIQDISKDEIVTLDYKFEEPNADREQWQLKRVNVEKVPLPETYSRHEVKDVPSHVYIIDSGIDKAHPDLAPRLAPADQHKAFTTDSCVCNADGPLCDCGGHGTHCAGLVASPQAGYNINTTLHSAKVFNASGSASYATILNAMNWVIEAHKSHLDEVTVVSMSLGGGKNTALNAAVTAIKNAGMFITVAAGNSNKDSCTGSPSSSPDAYTVGASEWDDSRAYFSEFGYFIIIKHVALVLISLHQE